MNRTTRTTLEHTIRTEHRDFNIRDEKGRAVGARVTTYEVEHTPFQRDPENPYAGGWEREEGHFFIYKPHATRDGHGYGASQNEVYFKTAAERDAGVEKYFATTAKRYAKKYAPKES